MATALAVTLCLLGLSAHTLGLLTGFPKDRCDDMDPTLVDLPKQAVKDEEHADLNSTDYFEESLPSTVQSSDRLNLYRIVTSSTKYRRGGVLDITIRGPEFNAFMLQVRKVGADERRGYDKVIRVGEFTSWPPSLQPVMCDQGKATAITNKNFQAKKDIVVKWKAPKDNVGDIHVIGRFIQGDEYWQLTESREIPMNEFPVNLAKCGKAKSCILYSETSDSCHEDNCDFILTYTVVNHTFVEFVLGGNAKKENSYLAVGFSKSPEGRDMKLIACTRAKTVAEIKYFVVPSLEEGLITLENLDQSLENRKMDFDGDRLWCSFTLPISGHSGDGPSLDLSTPLYQAYMRGFTNNTRSVNVPILPSKPLISKNEIQIEKIKLQYHKMEQLKATASVPCVNLILIISGLYTLFYV